MRNLKGRVALATVALALMAAPALAAATAKHISPGEKITVSVKVKKRAPAGWFWWLSVVSLNRTQRNCATFAFKIFKTRGTVGQTLRTTFSPRMDVLRHRPSKWCSGKMAAEAQIDSYADRNFKHSKLVALSTFRVS